jgi:peroxiredoxin Q/BCP
MFLFLFSLKGNAQIEKMLLDEKIPSFSLLDDAGMYWDSKNANGKFLVVYFYPAAMTGGCTKQACAYRDRQEVYQSMNISVIGISGDEVENLKRFKKSYDLNFPLLSDGSGEVAELFGVPSKKGKKTIKREFDGFEVLLKRNTTAARWTFVFNPEGSLIYKNDQVKAAQDSKVVENVIKQYLKK